MKHIRNGIKIETFDTLCPEICPPSMRWAACYGEFDLGVHVGTGATEEEAIQDLLNNYPEEGENDGVA